MKKIFLLLIIFSCSLVYSQTTISFEASEGYELGSIHDQKGWEVTEHDEDGFITNQLISDEKASDGNYSFKNGHEPDYDFQWFPIFGATILFDEPYDFEDFSISYDMLATGQIGSDFEFSLFGINEYEEWTPVAGVGVENRGEFYFTIDEYYDFEYAEQNWEVNEWIQVKIEINQDEIKYYINDVLETTIPNFSQLEILGFNMLHNNYGYDAYYDNFKINSEGLNLSKNTKERISVFPNPVEDYFSIHIPSEISIERVQIFNMLGQEVLSQTFEDKIKVSALAEGNYILKVIGSGGEVFTKKLIKK